MANDLATENLDLRIVDVSGPVNGMVFLDGPTITYRHDGSETIIGGFNYVATDETYFSNAAVAVEVVPVNDPPTVLTDETTVEEGGTVVVEVPALLANDTDAEGDALEFLGVSDGVNGTVLRDGTTIIFEHDGSETTSGSFLYVVSDSTDTATGTVKIAVMPVNDPPVATDDSATIEEGNTLSILAAELLVNDMDAERDSLSLVEVGDAVNGVVSLKGSTVTYEHDGSETVDDGFTYTVSDGVETDTATVIITVTPVNDPPVAIGDSASTMQGGTLTIEAAELLANDTDAEVNELGTL